MNEPAPIETAPAPKPRNSLKARILFWGGSFAVILLLVGMMIPQFVKARTTSCKGACTANLKQIDGAVQQWALEQKKLPTDKPDLAGVKSFMKGGELPKCPGGGTYLLPDTITGEPKCSLGGSIQQQDKSGHP